MRSAAPDAGPNVRDDRAPQLVDAEARRVDDAGGARAERREPLALERDAFEDARPRCPSVPRHRERVRTARLAEATEDRLVGGVEEEHVQVAPAAVLERGEDATDLAEERANAHVDAERDARDAAVLAERDGVGRERGRQVVDAEEAEVLERVERGRAPGAGEAGDDDDHRLARLGGASRGRGPGGGPSASVIRAPWAARPGSTPSSRCSTARGAPRRARRGADERDARESSAHSGSGRARLLFGGGGMRRGRSRARRRAR